MANQPPKFFSVILIFLGLTIITFFVFYIRANAPPKPKNAKNNIQNTSTSSTLDNKPIITIADPSIGPNNAKLTIVEFADYSCSHCGTVNNELKNILATYPNQVRLVWKDFPVYSADETALLPFEAAHCADKQKKFWEFHETIFENQIDFSKERLITIAQNLNLDMTQFQTCLDSGETKPLIFRTIEEGQKLGVEGTPFFFINGEKFNSNLTTENIAELLK